MRDDNPSQVPVSVGHAQQGAVNPGNANPGAAAPGSPSTSVVLTPAGRPLLHFTNYQGEVHPVLGKLSDAINILTAQTAGVLPEQERVLAGLVTAAKQANAHLVNGAAPDELELSLALSAITGGTLVGPFEVLGTEQYDTLDLRWVKSFLNYLTTKRVPFPTHLQLTPITRTITWIPEKVTLAIAGDWGTGIESALSISRYIAKRNPDYTIHLGDVYYSGLPEEESLKLVELWPAGSRGSLTLNSNHEMYAGGHGYFGVALADRKFALQNGLSYFALQNRNWMIIGLDTAYFAVNNLLYQKGYLSAPGETNGTVQFDWFQGMIQYAAHADMNVIILTHHDGFDVDPYAHTVTFENLFHTMTAAMQNVKRWWWYWGHVHAGITYRSITTKSATGPDSTVYPRCIGHGGIPWEPFSNLASVHLNDPRVDVEWAEVKTIIDSDGQSRALNGYLMVTLDGTNITETLYDEKNDATSWQPRY